MTNLLGTNLNSGSAAGPKGEGRDSPSKYQPYPEYKDSGVEWARKIPSHWLSASLKFLADIELGKMLATRNKGGMAFKPYLRAKNIRWLDVDVSDIYKMWFSNEEMLNLRLRKNDLLVSEGGEVGRTAIWLDEVPECYIQNSVNRVRFSKGSPRFFLYQFYAAGHCGYFDAIVNRISIAHLTKEKLGDAKFLSAPIDEQTQIATFLDRETQKIDRLIEKQQQLIKLLQEKRQAVISHAVTKGLNPTNSSGTNLNSGFTAVPKGEGMDSPSNVKMKDSGVEWLGEIPGHWEVKKIKHIKSKEPNSFVDGPFGSNLKSEHFVDNGDVYVIESNFATQNLLEESSLKTITKEHYLTIKRSSAKEGDIVIAKIGAQFGKAAILPKLDKLAVVSGNSLKLTVDKDFVNTDFILFVLTHLKHDGAMDDIVNATAQPALSLSGMNNLSIPLPPFSEQKDIANSIKDKLRHLDDVIHTAKRFISLSKERRTALISAAVTGKIDVRNIVDNHASNQSTTELDQVAG